MNTKTQKEVDAEIAKLKAMKPKIRQFDTFGGDNHRKLECEVSALKEGWDQGDVDDKLDDGELDDDEAGAAQAAIDWRDGNEEESPSKGWEVLVK